MPLNDVRGAVNGAGHRLAACGRAGSRPGSRRACAAAAWRAWPGAGPGAARRRRRSPGRWAAGGAGAAGRSSVSGGASGSRLHSSETRLAPDTPSTVAWCIFVNTAIEPSSSPSMTHISQSGLLRSRACPARSPHTAASCSRVAGRRHRHAAHVVLDVEVVVVDPHRVVEVEDRVVQLAAERGIRADALAQRVAQRFEVVRDGHRGLVDDQQPAHVEQVRAALQVQEAGVEPAQSVHFWNRRTRSSCCIGWRA